MKIYKKTKEASVFLLISLWERLSFALLEAMYMKKLCVVSKVIGNRDVIRTVHNGFLCESLNDYIAALDNAKNTGTSDLTNQAYKEILSVYNTRTMAMQYDKIYQSSIQKRQNQ